MFLSRKIWQPSGLLPATEQGQRFRSCGNRWSFLALSFLASFATAACSRPSDPAARVPADRSAAGSAAAIPEPDASARRNIAALRAPARCGATTGSAATSNAATSSAANKQRRNKQRRPQQAQGPDTPAHAVDACTRRATSAGCAKSRRCSRAMDSASSCNARGSARSRPGPRQGCSDGKTSTAVRIRLVLEELGPSFVKLGQIVSTRPDLVPADIIDELRRLQDDVPPVPFERMRAELEQQLGAPIAEVFAPSTRRRSRRLRSARSIAPACAARRAMQDVVVRSQRPNIASTIERDIDLLYWLAHAIERSIPEAACTRRSSWSTSSSARSRAELDYAQEADNAERFARNFAEITDVVVFPRGLPAGLVASKVITLAFIDGEKLLDAVAHGASARAHRQERAAGRRRR